MNAATLRCYLTLSFFIVLACGSTPPTDVPTDVPTDAGARSTASAGEEPGKSYVFIPGTAPDDNTDSASRIDTDSASDSESGDIGTDSGRDTDSVFDSDSDLDISFTVDPYGNAPLAAVIKVSRPGLIPEAVDLIRVTVEGRGDSAEDLTAELDPQSEAFQTNFGMSDLLEETEVGIPVLGLYHGEENRVLFEIETGDAVFQGKVIIPVDTLSMFEQETVTVDLMSPDKMEPGWTRMNGRVFDHLGNIRWKGSKIYQILKNGNMLVGVDEKNWLGKTVIDRTLPNHLRFHHDAVEGPDGNILVCVSNKETSVIMADGESITSIEDTIVELEQDTGDIVNAWDIRELLDVDRVTVASYPGDWFHMNTLAYDPADDTVLASGRYQGIVKLTRNGIQGDEPNLGKELVWILGPHLDWGMSGPDGLGGVDPNDYLLLAVDSTGTAYPDEVQKNLAAPEKSLDPFWWNVGQHGIQITEHAEQSISVLTFNNQASFIFNGVGSIDNGVYKNTQGDLSNDRSLEPYSQIIEYAVDEAAMTVTRAWSFGEGQPELYGSLNSGVTLLPKTGNRLMVSNGWDQITGADNPLNPHLVEVTAAGEVVFHLQIEDTKVSAYRGGRIDLYHPQP